MKSFLGLVQSAPFRVDIEYKDAQGRVHANTTTIKSKKDVQEEVPVYANKDSIVGEIRVTPMTVKRVEHQGIKIQLLGQIELASERGTGHEFVSLVRELAPPGDLNNTKVFPFEFKNVEMQYDSYKGQAARCRYLLRVMVTGKGMTPDTKKDFNIWVTNYELPSEVGQPIKMEVGIEDCLHIEFEYDRDRYHLKDVVVGKIYFLLVRIKLKHMEIEIRRKETVGSGSDARSDSETLAKYEIMDGAPVRGESVPIRLYLSPYDLSPSYKDVHNKYSVRYYLNLVLVDEEERRYFKQQEITLYRKAEDTPEEVAAAAAAGPPKLGGTPVIAPLTSSMYGAPSVPTPLPAEANNGGANGVSGGEGAVEGNTLVGLMGASPSGTAAELVAPAGASTSSQTTSAPAPGAAAPAAAPEAAAGASTSSSAAPAKAEAAAPPSVGGSEEPLGATLSSSTAPASSQPPLVGPGGIVEDAGVEMGQKEKEGEAGEAPPLSFGSADADGDAL